MHPVFLVIIPAVLVIVGMVLNNIGLSFEYTELIGARSGKETVGRKGN